MRTDTLEILQSEANRLATKLSSIEATDEEYLTYTKRLSEITAILREDQKVDDEAYDRTCRRNDDVDKIENQIKADKEKLEKDIAERKMDRYFRFAIGIGSIVIPVGFHVVNLICGYKFEEEGSLRSKTFQEARSRFPRF